MPDTAKRLSSEEIDQLIAAARAEKVQPSEIADEMLDGVKLVISNTFKKYVTGNNDTERVQIILYALIAVLSGTIVDIVKDAPPSKARSDLLYLIKQILIDPLFKNYKP